jgi:hypothetical protein
MTIPLAYALSGDLVHSRRVQNRSAAHRLIERALTDTNRRFAAELWAPLTLTHGIDEFSGVLLTPETAADLLRHLNLQLHPLQFRLGIGRGEVEKFAAHDTAGKLDGTSFHRAADALERARADHLPLAIKLAPKSEAGWVVRAIEALALLDSTIRADWTPAVVGIARILAAAPSPPTQAELGRRSKRSQQAVSRAFRRGRFDELALAEASLRELLAELHRRD